MTCMVKSKGIQTFRINTVSFIINFVIGKQSSGVKRKGSISRLRTNKGPNYRVHSHARVRAFFSVYKLQNQRIL